MAMLDTAAAPQKEDLGNGDCNDRQDCRGGGRCGPPPMVNKQFARLAKEERERNHNDHHEHTTDNVDHYCHHCNGNNNDNDENKGPPPPMPINSRFAAVTTVCIHINRTYSEGGGTFLITATLTATTIDH